MALGRSVSTCAGAAWVITMRIMHDRIFGMQESHQGDVHWSSYSNINQALAKMWTRRMYKL